MPGSAVDGIQQVRAHGTRRVTLGAIHEAIEDQRMVRAKKFRHFDLLGHAVLSDPLEDVVLRYLTASGVVPRRSRSAFSTPSPRREGRFAPYDIRRSRWDSSVAT